MDVAKILEKIRSKYPKAAKDPLFDALEEAVDPEMEEGMDDYDMEEDGEIMPPADIIGTIGDEDEEEDEDLLF